MGCFDSTCSITRTAVHVGDAVLMVCLHDVGSRRVRSDASTYELMNFAWHCNHERREGLDDMLKHLGLPKMTDAELLERNTAVAKRLGYIVVFGTYNDYGWLEEIENDYNYSEGDNEFKFFIHKSIVDDIVGGDAKAMNIFEVLEKITVFAHTARVELFHHHLLGEQYGVYSKHEEAAHQKLIDLMVLAHQFVYRKLEGDEDEE